MSRVSDVLKNKNKTKREITQRKKDSLQQLKEDSAYRAKLTESLKDMQLLLSTGEIARVLIEVPDKHLARFGDSIYISELSEYTIEQDLESEKPNRFYITMSYIDI